MLAAPSFMAARGMELMRASSGDWTITQPPVFCMARAPRAPSLPIPVRTIPTAGARQSAIDAIITSAAGLT